MREKIIQPLEEDVSADKARILVVDDDKYVVKGLQLILKKEGYEVSVANGGAEAIEMLKKKTFDVVLTDLKMEGVDGLQVLHQARLADPDTAVIMLTGHSSIETAIEGMKRGAFDYLIKPCSNDVIRMTVKRGVDRRLFDKERKAIAAEIERRALILAELNKIATIVGSSLDIESILRDVLAEIMRSVRADAGYVATGSNGSVFKVQAVQGFEQPKGSKIELDDVCLCGLAKSENSMIELLRNGTANHTIEHCAGHDFRNGICLPLDSRGKMLGLIFLATKRARVFSDHEYDFLQAVSNQIAMAVDNAQLFRKVKDMNEVLEKRVESRTAELRLLYRFSEEIAHVSTIQELFETLVGFITDLTRVEVVGLLTLTNEFNFLGLQFRHRHRKKDERQRQSQVIRKILGAFAGEASRTQLNLDIRYASDRRNEPKPLSGEVSFSLNDGDNPIGLIYIASARNKPINQIQKRMLSTVANQVCLAVHRLGERIRAEKSRVESMLESMMEGVILLDADYRIAVINPAGREMLRTINKNPNPRALRRLGKIPIDDVIHSAKTENGRARGIEVITEDDPQKIFSVSASSVRGLDEQEPGYVIVLQDITERYEAQEHVYLTSKLASIGELASGVAHEINNPLTSIVGFAQLMLMDETEEEKRENLQKIYEEGIRTKNIVKNLLGFARQRTGQQEIVNANALVQGVVQLFGKQPELNNIRMTVELSKELPPVYGDPGQLQQVFLNIIQNAMDAIEISGEGDTIEITTRYTENHQIAVDIKDNGPGIPKAIQKKIFNPFFTTKEVGQGTGLGLSICHKIMQAHDGAINFKSQAGKGTAFTVELPPYGGA